MGLRVVYGDAIREVKLQFLKAVLSSRFSVPGEGDLEFSEN